jgi:hypothetical protein
MSMKHARHQTPVAMSDSNYLDAVGSSGSSCLLPQHLCLTRNNLGGIIMSSSDLHCRQITRKASSNSQDSAQINLLGVLCRTCSV